MGKRKVLWAEGGGGGGRKSAAKGTWNGKLGALHITGPFSTTFRGRINGVLPYIRRVKYRFLQLCVYSLEHLIKMATCYPVLICAIKKRKKEFGQYQLPP